MSSQCYVSMVSWPRASHGVKNEGRQSVQKSDGSTLSGFTGLIPGSAARACITNSTQPHSRVAGVCRDPSAQRSLRWVLGCTPACAVQTSPEARGQPHSVPTGAWGCPWISVPAPGSAGPSREGTGNVPGLGADPAGPLLYVVMQANNPLEFPNFRAAVFRLSH